MDRKTALTWSWLNVLTKKRYDALRDVFGGLERALGAVGEEMLRTLGCREDTTLTILNRLEEFDAGAYEEELKRRSIHFLSVEDDGYPEKLREIGDPPVFLYYRGAFDILKSPCIALVGTREMSAYGKRVTQEFVPAFVRARVITVSGLALGIDAEVARETLAAGGKTVAVLGNGLGSVFPQSNARLAEEIVKRGGLLLSEFPLDTPPDKFTFPARNRIIAGLSLGTIVLEAPEGSGALITADLALDYGREVFVVPGQIFDPNYAGCHGLISRGHGKLVHSPTEVLADLGIIAPEAGKHTVYTPQNEDERVILDVLTTMPQAMDDLVGRTKLPVAAVSSALTMMELAGAARNVGGNQWVRG